MIPLENVVMASTKSRKCIHPVTMPDPGESRPWPCHGYNTSFVPDLNGNAGRRGKERFGNWSVQRGSRHPLQITGLPSWLSIAALANNGMASTSTVTVWTWGHIR